MFLLIAQLLDPIRFFLCGTAGFFGRKWWHYAVAVGLVAVIEEVFLGLMQAARSFEIGPFTTGILANIAWAAVGIWLRLRWDRRRVN